MLSKKIIGIIACIVVVLAVAIPVGMNKFGFSVDGKSSNKSAQNSNSNNDKTSENKEENKDDNNKENKDKEDSTTDKDNDKNSTSDNSNDSSNKGNNSSDNNSSTKDNSSDKNNTSNGDKVSSNYNTPDASLTIQRINGYSGMFIEDGSDKEVKNVAAIQVKNTSKQVVEYAQIELYNGDKKLVFEVSTLPANSSAVVMEKSKLLSIVAKMLHMENQLWHILTN